MLCFPLGSFRPSPKTVQHQNKNVYPSFVTTKNCFLEPCDLIPD